MDGVVARLQRRVWVEESDGVLHLSAAGRSAQQGLAVHVDRVRDRVRAALPDEEHVALLRLLARLVDGLPPA